MLVTDLNGLCNNLKNNQIFLLFILLGVCIMLYMMLLNYMKDRNDFTNLNVNMLYGTNSENIPNNYCKGDIPKLDEAIIRNMIDLPNRNPAMLTTSMIVPEPSKPTDEVRRKARMDVLNMFYSSFDDDLISIKARPQNLYIIP